MTAMYTVQISECAGHARRSYTLEADGREEAEQAAADRWYAETGDEDTIADDIPMTVSTIDGTIV